MLRLLQKTRRKPALLLKLRIDNLRCLPLTVRSRSMAFGFGVKLLNIRAKRKRTGSVQLRASQFAEVAAQEVVERDEN